jgi:hypothetical protein
LLLEQTVALFFLKSVLNQLKSWGEHQLVFFTTKGKVKIVNKKIAA